MKKLFAGLLCLGLLLLCACGERAAEDVTAENTAPEVTAVTEAPTTARVLQPLPEGCRFVEYDEVKEKLDKVWERQRDPSAVEFLKNKTQITRRREDGKAQLVLRDNTSGDEIVLTSPYEDEPYVKYVIDERYIVWTTYYRANNNRHGIYDMERDRYIEVEAGGLIHGMNGGYLYAIPRIQSEALRVYRIPLKGLDKKDRLEYDVDLLEGLPEAAMGEYQQIYFSSGLSPDCRYYAANEDAMGIKVFDLHTHKLVLHVPSEAVPERLYTASFISNKTLYCYGSSEEFAIEITLP